MYGYFIFIQLGCLIQQLHTSGSYWYMTNKKSWFDAERDCRQWLGHLATVSSPKENEFLLNQMRSRNVTAAWIGYNDRLRERDWDWTDPAAKCNTYTHWKLDEPNLWNMRCAEIESNWRGNWNRAACNHTKPYICQPQNPCSAIPGRALGIKRKDVGNGTWTPLVTCPPKRKITGFRVAWHRNGIIDGIQFSCQGGTSTGKIGRSRDSWTTWMQCSGDGYVTRLQLKLNYWSGAVALGIRCSGGDEKNSDKGRWQGEWVDYGSCTAGAFFCSARATMFDNWYGVVVTKIQMGCCLQVQGSTVKCYNHADKVGKPCQTNFNLTACIVGIVSAVALIALVVVCKKRPCSSKRDVPVAYVEDEAADGVQEHPPSIDGIPDGVALLTNNVERSLILPASTDRGRLFLAADVTSQIPIDVHRNHPSASAPAMESGEYDQDELRKECMLTEISEIFPRYFPLYVAVLSDEGLPPPPTYEASVESSLGKSKGSK